MAASIDPTPQYLVELLSMTHSPQKLRSKGFVLEPLTEAELLKKARCDRCNKRPRKITKLWRPKPKPKQMKENEDEGQAANNNSNNHQNEKTNVTPKAEQQQPPKPTCQWHPGPIRGKINLCCQTHVSTKEGCQTAQTHTLPKTLHPALTTRFQIYPTPPSSSSSSSSSSHYHRPHLAVALDCEMGTAQDGEPELIRVTLIDYFTGAPILDKLVWPAVAMSHYNTRYSGVTAAQMRAAHRERTCLFGVDAARRAVWRHVGPDTVVVGHDVKNDLGVLRWAHGVVVDSMMVEAAARKAKEEKEKEGGDAEAVDDVGEEKEKEQRSRETGLSVGGGGGGSDRAAQAAADTKKDGGDEQQDKKPREPGLSLKDVSKLRLGRDIQKHSHDSYEDALASRDIVNYYVVENMG